MIKTAKEADLLMKSAKISNSCIPIIERSLKEYGITEKEVAHRVEKNIRGQGASLSFKTLVASGERASMIHAVPHATNQVISGMGYVDFGASYRGYKTDVTVPFIKGKIGRKERKITNTVISAYKSAVSSWKYGMQCWRIHQVANDKIRSRGFVMGHAVGHGVGLRVHERPLIVMPRKKLTGKKLKVWERIRKIKFENGMFFTIEPGAYVKNVGGCRIENTFCVHKQRLKRLTNAKLVRVL